MFGRTVGECGPGFDVSRSHMGQGRFPAPTALQTPVMALNSSGMSMVSTDGGPVGRTRTVYPPPVFPTPGDTGVLGATPRSAGGALGSGVGPGSSRVFPQSQSRGCTSRVAFPVPLPAATLYCAVRWCYQPARTHTHSHTLPLVHPRFTHGNRAPLAQGVGSSTGIVLVNCRGRAYTHA